MNRRQALVAIGTSTLSLAGCLARETTGPGGAAGTATPPPPPRDLPPVNTGLRGDFEPETTYKEIEVGTRAGVDEDYAPHDLHIWNATAGQRTVNLRILDRVADESVHRAAYTIPAAAALRTTLMEPSQYFVQLWGPAIDTETLLVPCIIFDCNSSTTSISLYEDGHIGSVVSSTLVGCPSYDCDAPIPE